jgi:hypothetical protein
MRRNTIGSVAEFAHGLSLVRPFNFLEMIEKKSFPAKARFKKAMGAVDHKGVIVKGLIDYRITSEVGIPCAIKYKRVLKHYEWYGHFAWEEFGEELERVLLSECDRV